MSKCPQRFHIDQKEKGFLVCSICECNLGVHCGFAHCPLLKEEMMCVDCCHNSVPKDTIIEEFRKIGLEYTREQIEATCAECGNRSVGKPEESHGNDGKSL